MGICRRRWCDGVFKLKLFTMRMPKSRSKPELEIESPSGKFEKDRKRLAHSEKGVDDGSDLNNWLCSEGEYMGRSPGSWLKLSLYSIVFAACLVAFWGLCLGAFFQTLDKFLAEYEPGYWANAGASQTKCHMGRPPLTKQEACEFNKEWLSDQGSDIKCISEEHYGYYHGKPCILLKLNRVYGWQPVPYQNVTEVERLDDMPKSLKEHIRRTWEENCRGRGRDLEERCPQLDMVWLHCDGEGDPDKENIGSVSYTPWRGFPAYFLPYWNQLGYLQPIVMVQLKNPTPGVLINIQCTAWAKGIEHDVSGRRGSVHLEFLMD